MFSCSLCSLCFHRCHPPEGGWEVSSAFAWLLRSCVSMRVCARGRAWVCVATDACIKEAASFLGVFSHLTACPSEPTVKPRPMLRAFFNLWLKTVFFP